MKSLELCFTRPYTYSFEKGKLMRVSVRGASTVQFRKHLKLAAEFYASKLMSKRLVESLDVKIYIRKINSGDDGTCYYEDHDNGVRYFEIELDKQNSERQILINLAHEMVHVKQFSLGELKDGRPATTTVWQGITVRDEEIDYWDTPWEIEAHGREKGLFSRFKNHYGLIGMYKRPFLGDA